MEASPEERLPERTVTVNGITVVLNRENTRLRLFRPSSYNHVDFQMAEDRMVAFGVSEEVMQDLIERDYPRVEMDIRDDPASQAWYESYAMADLICRQILVLEDIVKQDS